MINKILNSQLFLAISSLIAAVMLFSYVNDVNGSISSVIGVDSSQTVSNVPITVNIDTDKYTVSGLPDSVVVRFDGTSSAILLAINNNTYRVETPDLNDLGVGKHTISLHVTGVDPGVTGLVTPETVEIIIEEKQTVEKKVDVNIDRANLSDSYSVGEVTLDHPNVSITGASSLIEQIQQVVANVTIPSGTNSTYSTAVTMQALDASGRALDVEIIPSTNQVSIAVSALSKTVPIQLIQQGAGVSGYSYQFNSDVRSVTVVAPQEVLDAISSIPVYVNVNNVNSTTTKTVTITPPEGVENVTPSTIEVTVTTTNNANSGSNSSISTTSSNDSTPTTPQVDSSSPTSGQPSSSSSGSENQSNSSDTSSEGAGSSDTENQENGQ